VTDVPVPEVDAVVNGEQDATIEVRTPNDHSSHCLEQMC
jgi:hypothetical protein